MRNRVTVGENWLIANHRFIEEIDDQVFGIFELWVDYGLSI